MVAESVLTMAAKQEDIKEGAGVDTTDTEIHNNQNPLRDPDEEQGQVDVEREGEGEGEGEGDEADIVSGGGESIPITEEEVHAEPNDDDDDDDDDDDADIEMSHIYKDSATDVIPTHQNPLHMHNNGSDENIAATSVQARNKNLEEEQKC